MTRTDEIPSPLVCVHVSQRGKEDPRQPGRETKQRFVRRPATLARPKRARVKLPRVPVKALAAAGAGWAPQSGSVVKGPRQERRPGPRAARKLRGAPLIAGTRYSTAVVGLK
ncbi:hypothetical protein SKAU_G00252030 [Synaphobranchus kaupii]|uniref:Uncharacterized protein n=1 Tax=Synaphobranchus kaupii TaxID=118154 RepID=A0A9Q1F326_SYNKA|nr:hypothetical protein SKAU_G00252030 [Synaphobranchus kaupii]